MTRAPHLPRGCTLVAFDSIASTNDHAKQMAKDGCAAGTVVWAQSQTSGRGRQGNAWTSLPGNLFMTLVLRPETMAAETGQLSFLAAVALARTLEPLLPPGVNLDLKWPNDVLLGGKKAAGILLETELNGANPVPWVVIGIGVNITGAPDGAASLASVGIDDVVAVDVLESLVGHIMALYASWRQGGFAPIRAEWLDHAVSIGREINVRLPRETFTGTFVGLDDSGALQLSLPDGSKKIVASGEVFI